MIIHFFQKWGRLSLILLLFVVIASIVIFLNEILFPFILACFLAYLLAPVIQYMNQWRIRRYQMPRGLAVIVVYIIILGALFGGGAYLVPNLSNEITAMLKAWPAAINQNTQKWMPVINQQLNQWAKLLPPVENGPVPNSVVSPKAPPQQTHENPTYLAALEDYTYEIRTLDSGRMEVIPRRKTLQTTQEAKPLDVREHLSTAIQNALQAVEENTINFLNFGRQILAKVAGSVFTLFLTFMISAFILIDTERILKFTQSLLVPRYHQGYAKFLRRLDRGLSGVVRGQIIICLVNGTFTGLGLLIFGVPFVFTLSIVATICSLIPIFGTFLSSVPIVIMALTVSFPTALLIIGWILFIHFIEGNILNPKIMGTAAHIHPALVVFALVAGQYVAGIAGALLAVPIFSILQNTFLFVKSTIEEIEPLHT